MRRREFIGLLGSAAAAWPQAARAQQESLALVGFLQPGAPSSAAHYVAAFRQGLLSTGHVEGKTLIVEYRWAEGHYERLYQLATDLVARGVSVIAAGGPGAVAAVKSVTSTIPIVFIVGDDPVQDGLVASLNHPGGNLTGVAVFTTADLWGKRLQLLHELLPVASAATILINPNEPNPETEQIGEAGRALGLELSFVNVTTDAQIEAVFAAASGHGNEAILVSDKPFFTARHSRIAGFAARYLVPAIYGWREYVEAGGLISYGSRLSDAWEQVGIYTGKILNGEQAGELPVVQPTTFELAINMKTAYNLGLTVPATLLARADEVIE
jgi:putative tryptophan/tyrosine transport system substrate-binding protein